MSSDARGCVHNVVSRVVGVLLDGSRYMLLQIYLIISRLCVSSEGGLLGHMVHGA